MDGSAKDVALLLYKKKIGVLSDEERFQLDTWTEENKAYRDLVQAVNDETFVMNKLREYHRIQIPPVKDILDRVPSNRQADKSKHWIRRYLPYAAALLISFSALGSWYMIRQQSIYEMGQTHNVDILPGGNKATLTLSNGDSFLLRGDQDGIAIKEDGIRYQDGTALSTVDAVGYATLHVPRAGQYQLALPDGTKVWLNADSELTYPMAFTGEERVVHLKGEAYFEVTSDKSKPFYVQCDGQNIRVLGTAFNIQAHTDQLQHITTLVEGSIALQTSDGKSSILHPNEQAILSGNQLDVKRVNAQQYAMWKDGIIVLNRQDIQSIIPQLERWYDVEFEQSAIPQRSLTLSGEIPRDIKLSNVLNVLGEQLKLKFEIVGRRIVVKS